MRYDLAARTAPALAIVRTVGASMLMIAMMLVMWATFDPAAAQTACTTRSVVAERLAGRELVFDMDYLRPTTDGAILYYPTSDEDEFG